MTLLSRFAPVLLAFAAASFVPPAPAQSPLWGEAGEKWDPAGPLPDFSFAGYRRGERALPEREPTVWVTDYGATPDADATEAFRKALAENPGACVGVPAGRFLLSDRIRVTTRGTVLKGAGPRATVLQFTRSLEQIEPNSTTNGDGQATSGWSWGGGLIVVGDGALESTPKRTITGDAKRGDSSLTVESPAGIAVGDDVRIELSDDPAGSLTDYLYRGEPGDAAALRGKETVRQVARVTALDGDRLTLDRPLRTDVRAAWTPTLRKFVPEVEECGLEGVAIEFEPGPYRGHFREDGYNGVEVNGTHNWVRDVTVKNGDSGIYVHGQFNTVSGVALTADRVAHSSGNTGHHGLTANGQDCLFTDFTIRTKFYHDLSVDGGATGNVFSAGRGSDLCLDHHRNAPYENLFTDLHLGKGTRPWQSGGASGKGSHTASGATFWGLDSLAKVSPPGPDFGPPGLLFIGLNANDGGVTEPVTLPGGWYYEPHRPTRLEPANLHRAQLRRRLGTEIP